MNEQLRTLISQVLKVPPESVSEQMQPSDCAGWDSLSHLELIAEIEQTFSVSIPLNKAISIARVSDFFPLIPA